MTSHSDGLMFGQLDRQELQVLDRKLSHALDAEMRNPFSPASATFGLAALRRDVNAAYCALLLAEREGPADWPLKQFLREYRAAPAL